jgi:hypothetical protein
LEKPRRPSGGVAPEVSLQKFIYVQFAFFVLFSSLSASAATPFKATTTLSAETSNNTSAADSFKTLSDGDIAGANVSKVPVKNLLYSGSTTKIYAQFLPWFGFGDHMDVGYISTDLVQVQKQVNDMVSRGIDGAIIDWYGRGTLNSHFVSYDQTSQELLHQAEAHPGFTFAIQHDAVALKNCNCDVTQMLIDDLNYANRTFQGSAAYLHYNGRPVFFFFGHEAYAIDWNRVRSSVAGNPLFIFRNAGAFTAPQSDGGYSWVEPTIPGLTYIDGYYAAALNSPSKPSTGSAYAGFDDSLALWGSHRYIAQQCGQTFLASMAEAGKYYSATNQMLGIQMVTWNDYEEGTEMETGIENCVTVNASASGSVVSWKIAGQMNTIDHFTVFASQDGQNLMWLADEGTNVSSLDLAQFGLPSGNYTIFVKAIAKPMMTNKMSSGVSMTLGGTPAPTADLLFSAPGGTTATVKAGQTANYSLQLSATGGPSTVTITCSDAAAKSACTAPSAALTVTPGTPANLAISITTTANAAMLPWFRLKTRPRPFWLLVLLVPVAVLAQKMLLAPRGRKLNWKPAFAASCLLLGALLIGCGGNASSSAKPAPTPAPTPTPTPSSVNGTPAGTYTVVVTATSGSINRTEQLTLTVQ